MRPTWKGSISFGLVYIPVAVYPATREEKISFRQLRSSDLSPIRYKKVAEADSKEVPADQIVKGFEFERGRYVVMKDEDFEKVRIESTHSIDITDFVDLEQVDPKFFYKPYFLEPQKGGEKAYAVLHKALSGTGKIGIAKVVISNREHLAAVKPDGLFLILELMHFASEILSTEVLKNGSATAVSDKELKDGAGAHRKYGRFLGTRKVSGRIPDGIDGDHRAESAEQRDRGESACSSGPNQCCRSC